VSQSGWCSADRRRREQEEKGKRERGRRKRSIWEVVKEANDVFNNRNPIPFVFAEKRLQQLRRCAGGGKFSVKSQY
jgi:hypothetical protein